MLAPRSQIPQILKEYVDFHEVVSIIRMFAIVDVFPSVCEPLIRRFISIWLTYWASMKSYQWLATLNKGTLLVLPEQRTAVTSAFIFVVYSPMYRYCRKWYSSWMKSWHPFVNEHQLFSVVSMGNCKVVVLPENWSLAFSVWWNNRNHFDGVFMEYLSGIQPHVYFLK